MKRYGGVEVHFDVYLMTLSVGQTCRYSVGKLVEKKVRSIQLSRPHHDHTEGGGEQRYSSTHS
jgi:hypothetical protein